MLDQDIKKTFRYERKFFVDQINSRDVISMIKMHPSMFKELYPPRYINNIYMDDPLMSSYHDNVDGLTYRRKLRIRWYHDLFGKIKNPILEFKLKNGIVGAKASYPFPPFSIEKNFSEKYFLEIGRKSDLPMEVKTRFLDREIVLLNRYFRWYFATPDKRFRVTIDTDLSFYHFHKFNNSFRYKHKDLNSTVVELKYQTPDDMEGNRISSIFPFRMTRNSKYVNGIEKVYL